MRSNTRDFQDIVSFGLIKGVRVEGADVLVDITGRKDANIPARSTSRPLPLSRRSGIGKIKLNF